MTNAFPEVTGNRLGPWLDDTLDNVPHARFAVLGTMDGLLMARSLAIDTDSADKLTAAATGSVSLARAQARDMQLGPWVQSISEFDGHYLVMVSAGANAFLAAVAGKDVDMGVLSFALQTLVSRLGSELDSPSRTDTVPAT
ncbi:roadblock/LC7 domain-containing protein [Umezawaea sp. Da 62-37]|uniref:roadblock/LC7 domain-containing protein n=1 Tax=Umezawaea sp. Da 62-37 TaxID=3075927 RepID=UPI0028F72F5B|nr:roadblock/LC7 domain-containing protein [Umezawaea sp. Da 62-37]WNV85016.1 roadblock/LC7 domain-containing protein [Umezawaea sp. Da 62-37]